MDHQADTSVRVKRELSDPPAGRDGSNVQQSSSYRRQHAPPPRPLVVHDYDNIAAHVKKEPSSPPLRPASITSARDNASAPRERSTGTTSERGMMDPPSSPLGPPPTRLSHVHRRSITPEKFYDADDALPPPPTKLCSDYIHLYPSHRVRNNLSRVRRTLVQVHLPARFQQGKGRGSRRSKPGLRRRNRNSSRLCQRPYIPDLSLLWGYRGRIIWKRSRRTRIS